MEKNWLLVDENGEHCGLFTPQEVRSRFVRYASRKKLYADAEGNLYLVVVLQPKRN